MIKEYLVIIDWLGFLDRIGKFKIVKKGFIIKCEFDINNILLVEYVNDKGNIVKKFIFLIDKEKGDMYKINMFYEKVKKYIGEDFEIIRVVVKGYMDYKKKK